MGKFSGSYSGDDLLTKDFGSQDPLIEGFLWPSDNNILFGREKSGKSIFALQMCCSLTSGEPFLGRYEVSKPQNVLYIQAEGKIQDTQANLKNMMRSLDFNPKRYQHIYLPNIQLNKPEGIRLVEKMIDDWKQPGVILGDPIYKMMAGSMTDDEASSTFTSAWHRLGDKYGSAHVVLHHAHRPPKTEHGFLKEEGISKIFGSFVWGAFPDNVFYIERKSKGKHELTSDTQRMAKGVESLYLDMVEPSPLYFRINDGMKTAVERKLEIASIIEKLNGGATVKNLMVETGLEKRMVWYYIHELKSESKIISLSTEGYETTFKKS